MREIYKLISFIAFFNFGFLLALGMAFQAWPLILWVVASLWAVVGGFAYSKGQKDE